MELDFNLPESDWIRKEKRMTPIIYGPHRLKLDQCFSNYTQIVCRNCFSYISMFKNVNNIELSLKLNQTFELIGWQLVLLKIGYSHSFARRKKRIEKR